ncbi:aromatic amino acid lyase, partial [Staphylococcus aureus]
MFELGDKPVTLGFIERASRPGTQVGLSAQGRARVAAARAVVDRHAEGAEPIYGLNTGLGGNVGFRLPPSEIDAFQVQMIRGR